MSMSASSVAMMIGAESATARTAAEAKMATGGKSFAASLDERIVAEAGSDEKACAEMTVPQVRTNLRRVVNGTVKGMVYDPDAIEESSQKPVESMKTTILESKGQTMVPAPAQQAVDMKSVAKAEGAGAPTVAVVQKIQQSCALVVRSASAEDDAPADIDAKPSVEISMTAPDTAKYESNKQLHPAKLRSPDAMPEAAHDDRSALSVQTSSASVQVIRQEQKKAPSDSESNIATASGENANSAKESAKRRGSVKIDASLKRTDFAANVGSSYTDSTRSMCGAAIAFTPSIAQSITCSKPQEDIQPATQQAVEAAAVTGKAAHILVTKTSQQSETQHGVATGKSASDEYGISSHPVVGAHAAEENAQASRKPVPTLAVHAAPLATPEMAKPPAKLLSTEVMVPGSHPAGANGVIASPPGGSTALQPPAASAQKNVPGDLPCSSIPVHNGNGELPGLSGMPALATNEIHRTLVSTPTVLEVGIPNGTQGWLKVRAELTGGGVNATLSTASTAGQEMLHRELPSLTAYLQQQSVPVRSVVINTASGGGLPGFFGESGGGAGRHAQQEQGRSTYLETAAVGNNPHDEVGMTNMDGVLSAVQRTGGGSWLSVRA